MKNYIYKLSILVIFIYFLYEFTIGKEIRIFRNELINKFELFEVQKYNSKIREEAKRLLKKDKIFYEDDAKIISELIKKISKELDLD